MDHLLFDFEEGRLPRSLPIERYRTPLSELLAADRRGDAVLPYQAPAPAPGTRASGTPTRPAQKRTSGIDPEGLLRWQDRLKLWTVALCVWTVTVVLCLLVLAAALSPFIERLRQP